MIFNIPHASTRIDDDVELRLSPDELAKELLLMTDHFTDELFNIGANGDDHRVVAEVSRLVVDTERFLDDRKEVMAAHGMGVIYTRTHDGRVLRDPPTEWERADLIRRFYRSHHEKLEDAVEQELNQNDFAVILDCHSYPSKPLPYEFCQTAARPDICLGLDATHSESFPLKLLEQLFRHHGYSVAQNTPFSGSIVPAKYSGNSDVASLMFEIRRGLYMDESTGERTEDFSRLQQHLGQAIHLVRTFFESEQDEGQVVRCLGELRATHEWDSGGPGAGAGCDELYELYGVYYEFHDAGLSEYASLEDVRAGGFFNATDATTEIAHGFEEGLAIGPESPEPD